MNEIQKWSFHSSEIRTLTIDGEPWFVGKDVATILGYANPQKALRDHIDDEDKTVNDSFTVNGTSPILINESGLYSLILSSKLPTAKEFKRWVTSEVLPAIRKTGVYISGQNTGELSPMLQYLIQLEQKQNALEQRQSTLEEKLEKDREKLIKDVWSLGTIPFQWQKQIEFEAKSRAIEQCITAECYATLGKRVISNIHYCIQKTFCVASYRDLKNNQFTDALNFIRAWEPDAALTIAISKKMGASVGNVLDAFFEVPTGGDENDA